LNGDHCFLLDSNGTNNHGPSIAYASANSVAPAAPAETAAQKRSSLFIVGLLPVCSINTHWRVNNLLFCFPDGRNT